MFVTVVLSERVGGEWDAVDHWKREGGGGADRVTKGQDMRGLGWRRRFILTQGGPR